MNNRFSHAYKCCKGIGCNRKDSCVFRAIIDEIMDSHEEVHAKVYENMCETTGKEEYVKYTITKN